MVGDLLQDLETSKSLSVYRSNMMHSGTWNPPLIRGWRKGFLTFAIRNWILLLTNKLKTLDVKYNISGEDKKKKVEEEEEKRRK